MRLRTGSSEEVAGQRHLPQRPACCEGRSQSCEDAGVSAFQAEERAVPRPPVGSKSDCISRSRGGGGGKLSCLGPSE